MAIVSFDKCECPISLDTIVCARCGGTLPTATMGLISNIEPEIQRWFYELDSESRLNTSLGMYMAMDRQARRGIPVTTVVQEAVREIGSDLNDFREQVHRMVVDEFNDLKGANENSIRQIVDFLKAQVEMMLREIKSLVEQGKSVADIESRVREATATLQSYLTSIRLPSVKGEEGEANVVRDLQDAFLGSSCVRIEPIGGADATDAVVKFCNGDIEIGRSLVEVKSRKTWSSDFLIQVRDDMKRYNAALSLLAMDKLPKTAKARGFHVDIGKGIIITAPPELVVPTVTMFYEICSASDTLQGRTLDFRSVLDDEDLAYYVNDNMKILDDCKKISDIAEHSATKIKEHIANINSRLQENNRKVAKLLSKFSERPQEPHSDE
jgi:hypothetical protein